MIRAYVKDDPMSFGVRVAIVNHYGDDGSHPREVLRIDGDTYRWDEIPLNAAFEPTLTLPGEFARALLDGLTCHYQGVDDMRSLRRDYDAERKRVDALIEHLAAIAKQSDTPAAQVVQVTDPQEALRKFAPKP